MPPILSKPSKPTGWAKLSAHNLFLKNNNRKVMTASILGIILILIKLRLTKQPRLDEIGKLNLKKEKKGKGNVDIVFLKRILSLIKIVIPRLNSPEVFDLI